ncbi:MAG: hypothetical protein FWE52_00325 [Alphaproteobacteria bacterium]|nr:hypothetical protein [Alphaproteobacteria bacterium]
MEYSAIILTIIKYIVAAAIIVGILMYPPWLARQNKVDNLKMGNVRFACWVFGWTIVGWFLGLYWAARK